MNLPDPVTFPELLDFEKKPLGNLHKKMLILTQKKNIQEKDVKKFKKLQLEFQKKAKNIYKKLDNWERTQVARHPKRPYALDYIGHICEDFTEFSGDRLFGEDQAILGGVARIGEHAVVVVGQQKGRTTEENIRRNFGMPHPEGYRKALRLFRLADKFNKPIITFIDTPGAYPGVGAEERGQAEAIARNLQVMFTFRVPIIAIIIGEGGSGGALALSVANYMIMLENSIYSVISPESCAAILWKNEAFKREAALALKNDAYTAKTLKVIDEIVKEAPGGAHRDEILTSTNLKTALVKQLNQLKTRTGAQLVAERMKKFAAMGVFTSKKIS